MVRIEPVSWVGLELTMFVIVDGLRPATESMTRLEIESGQCREICRSGSSQKMAHGAAYVVGYGRKLNYPRRQHGGHGTGQRAARNGDRTN